MASCITGAGMAIDLKLQCKAVRATVEKRPRKAIDGKPGREQWLLPAYVTVVDPKSGERRIAQQGYTQPTIRPRDRHGISTRRA